MSILKKIYILSLTLFISSCTLSKIDNVHGISNLKNKIKLIKINSSNKNDVNFILGPAPLEDKKVNKFLYFEVRETKNKLGKKNIYVNDYVEIFFDKYNITKKIELYDLNNMNKIKFTKNITKSYAIKDTFSKNLLSSTRKRMENARKKFEK
jgi:outer membrane protein assembly factor BamE (lipoprotein component of BamABCDE complex)